MGSVNWVPSGAVAENPKWVPSGYDPNNDPSTAGARQNIVQQAATGLIHDLPRSFTAGLAKGVGGLPFELAALYGDVADHPGLKQAAVETQGKMNRGIDKLAGIDPNA